LDFARYAELNNIMPTMYENYSISFETLVEVGKMQGLDLRRKEDGGDIEVGDILLVRTGFMKHCRSISEEERAVHHLAEPKFGPEDGQRYIGVGQSEEMLDFLHNSYFSAVAADNPAFEAWPSHESKTSLYLVT
jgi:kynurenine formamidase